MNSAAIAERDLDTDTGVDAIEEMRLRTWARRNYAPESGRDATWHAVILDEMARIDRED